MVSGDSRRYVIGGAGHKLSGLLSGNVLEYHFQTRMTRQQRFHHPLNKHRFPIENDRRRRIFAVHRQPQISRRIGKIELGIAFRHLCDGEGRACRFADECERVDRMEPDLPGLRGRAQGDDRRALKPALRFNGEGYESRDRRINRCQNQ
mgnify:CR=1 FL=1